MIEIAVELPLVDDEDTDGTEPSKRRAPYTTESGGNSGLPKYE